MATVIPLSFQYLPAGLGEFERRQKESVAHGRPPEGQNWRDRVWRGRTELGKPARATLSSAPLASRYVDAELQQTHQEVAEIFLLKKSMIGRCKSVRRTATEIPGYVNKVIKLPELLRGNRKHCPFLLLALDRIEPLDLIILRGLRLGAQADGLVLRPVLPKKQMIIKLVSK